MGATGAARGTTGSETGTASARAVTAGRAIRGGHREPQVSTQTCRHHLGCTRRHQEVHPMLPQEALQGGILRRHGEDHTRRRLGWARRRPATPAVLATSGRLVGRRRTAAQGPSGVRRGRSMAAGLLEGRQVALRPAIRRSRGRPATLGARHPRRWSMSLRHRRRSPTSRAPRPPMARRVGRTEGGAGARTPAGTKARPEAAPPGASGGGGGGGREMTKAHLLLVRRRWETPAPSQGRPRPRGPPPSTVLRRLQRRRPRRASSAASRRG
mmetsp:Transcript_94060/g.269631  ORF Transcript_94060/g.269631 Transcript_94060/m.269631 type:complete len:269 (-) Transcript_94060:354-1160(-)